MNFYISSRLSNTEQVRHVASQLKNNGWTHTFDWTSIELPLKNGTDGLQAIAGQDYNGVKTADIVIVLTPLGRGTHIELGMAVALGKKIYLYHEDNTFFKCDDNTSAFYWLPQIKHLTGKIDNAVEVILQENIESN